MNAMVIAGRELRERSRTLLNCAVFALMPFLAAALPTSRGHRGEVIAVMGGSLAVAFGLGIAVAMGVSVIAGDLKERRMSYYFSKPVSAASIWIGKASASILLALAGYLVIALPAYFVSGRVWFGQWTITMPMPWQVLAGIVVLFFLSHVLSTVSRSRSAILGLDFVLLVLAAGTTVMLARPLLMGGALETLKQLTGVLACALLVITMAAPAWQLERGRADIRRSHAQLSLFLWSGVFTVLVLAAAFVFWFVRVTPSSLVNVHGVTGAPSGSWMFVTGQARNRGDYAAGFLLDGSTGSYERIGPGLWWGISFSDDGRTAAWLEPRVSLFSRDVRLALKVRRAGESGDPDTGVELPASAAIVLSSDGSRLGVTSNEGIAVYETGSSRLLASAKMPAWPDGNRYRRGWLMFTGRDLLRGYELNSAGAGQSDLRMWEFDARSRRFAVTGQVHLAVSPYLVSVSRDGSRLAFRESGEVLDGRTGARLAQGVADGSRSWGSAMLGDGSVATLTKEQGVIAIRLVDREGVERWRTPLPGAAHAVVSAEAGDQLIVHTRRQLVPNQRDSAMVVIDRATGRVERTLERLTGPWPWWYRDPRLPHFDAGQWLTGVDANEKVVLWNPRTGEKRLAKM